MKRRIGVRMSAVPMALVAAVAAAGLTVGTTASASTQLPRADHVVSSTALAMTGGPQWSLTVHPNPPSSLDSVFRSDSCPTSSFCMAVGNIEDQNGYDEALTEVLQNGSWTSVPNPTVTGSELSDVSCTSVTFCVAVGTIFGSPDNALIESWNGSSWTQEPSVPPGIKDSELFGVSCVRTSCAAAGQDENSGGFYQPFVETSSTSGSTWLLRTIPAVSATKDSWFNDVHCTAVNLSAFCMAVGGSGSNVDEPFAAMSTNAGSSWTAVSPAGLSASNDLTDVSCTGSTFCLAVGENYSTDRAFTEAWNGHTWASPAAQPVNPSSTYDYLNFVDCTSPTVCTAVGDESNGHDGQTLVEALKSGTWTVASTADPGGPGNDNFLHAVSCTTSSCIAVGEYYDGTAWEPLGLSQGANSWSALDGQGAAVSVLAGVSCVAETTFCMAAGNHTTGDAVIDSALTEVRSGSTWQVSGAANVPGSQYTQLTGVSCPTSTQCVTVGTYYSSKAERNETLADLYSSGSWTVAFPANLGTESDNLTQVSCWSTADCSAVGNYDDAGVEKTLAEYTTNGGRTWMVATDSNPGGASVLSDVSCTSTACVAVGAYQNGSTELALVERSTNGGRTWQQVTIPGVSGASSVALEGVSCLGGSTGTCIAVGYSVVGAVERALAEHSGNEGATWAVGSVPASGAASALFSVSCWAQFDCVAVGGQLSSSATGGIGVISPRSVVAAPRVGELTPGNVALPGSEGLSAFASAASSQVLAVASSNGGATWTVNTTPDASSMANDLGSVACPSATQCVGVGLSTQSDLVEQTLIETRS